MVRTPWKSCISPLQQNRTENNFLTRVYHGQDTVEILYQPTATEQNRKQFPNQGLPWSGHISPTEYKNLSWVWGADRKIRPRVTVSHDEALPNSDPEGWIFLSAPNNHDRFFFLHTFRSQAFDFNIGVASDKSFSFTLKSAILKVDVVCDVAMTSSPIS